MLLEKHRVCAYLLFKHSHSETDEERDALLHEAPPFPLLQSEISGCNSEPPLESHTEGQRSCRVKTDYEQKGKESTEKCKHLQKQIQRTIHGRRGLSEALQY